MNTEVYGLGLRKFDARVGATSTNRVALVIDIAGWHTTDKLELREGIDLERPLSDCPELQPVEPLWPERNQATANRCFDNLDQLEVLSALGAGHS